MIGFEPIKPKHRFYRPAWLSNVSAFPYGWDRRIELVSAASQTAMLAFTLISPSTFVGKAGLEPTAKCSQSTPSTNWNASRYFILTICKDSNLKPPDSYSDALPNWATDRFIFCGNGRTRTYINSSSNCRIDHLCYISFFVEITGFEPITLCV